MKHRVSSNALLQQKSNPRSRAKRASHYLLSEETLTRLREHIAQQERLEALYDKVDAHNMMIADHDKNPWASWR